jgi:6-phosphogluconolactonase
MKNVELLTCSNPDELARTVAQAWIEEVAAANRAGQPHFVALSGGRITLKLFAAVIELSRAQNVGLGNVHFFWADERCVPPRDPESSYGIALEAFFRPLGIATEKIHRVIGEESPERAAELANETIKRSAPRNAAGQPVLDVIFLGLGEDGHVASLFPRETEMERANLAVYRVIENSPKPPLTRVTLGYPALAAARQVWVLASGAGKEEALRDSLASDGNTPLARVLQLRAKSKVFTDLAVG